MLCQLLCNSNYLVRYFFIYLLRAVVLLVRIQSKLIADGDYVSAHSHCGPVEKIIPLLCFGFLRQQCLIERQ